MTREIRGPNQGSNSGWTPRIHSMLASRWWHGEYLTTEDDPSWMQCNWLVLWQRPRKLSRLECRATICWSWMLVSTLLNDLIRTPYVSRYHISSQVPTITRMYAPPHSKLPLSCTELHIICSANRRPYSPTAYDRPPRTPCEFSNITLHQHFHPKVR